MKSQAVLRDLAMSSLHRRAHPSADELEREMEEARRKGCSLIVLPDGLRVLIRDYLMDDPEPPANSAECMCK